MRPARIVAAAQAVLATLDDAGRATLQFPLEGPQTTRWSNLPSPMFERRGLRLADLTASQRAAVMTLLSTALSRDGYQKGAEHHGGRRGAAPGRRRGAAAEVQADAAAPPSGAISTTSRSLARPPRRSRGGCSTVAITSRSI
jgi:hypothetical protein